MKKYDDIDDTDKRRAIQHTLFCKLVDICFDVENISCPDNRDKILSLDDINEVVDWLKDVIASDWNYKKAR